MAFFFQPTTIVISVMSASLNASMTCSMTALPPTGSSYFGMALVYGFSLVPIPAAGISPFMFDSPIFRFGAFTNYSWS